MKHSDGVCLHTTWPWIFQPDSIFLNIWECVVVIAVMAVSVFYPYQFAFHSSFSNKAAVMVVLIDAVYLMDIVFQIFTAIDMGDGTITSFVACFF